MASESGFHRCKQQWHNTLMNQMKNKQGNERCALLDEELATSCDQSTKFSHNQHSYTLNSLWIWLDTQWQVIQVQSATLKWEYMTNL